MSMHLSVNTALLILVAATLVSWLLNSAGLSSGQATGSVVAATLLIAFVKVGMIAASFMELQWAARWLQCLFAAWMLGFMITLAVVLI